MNQFSEKHVVEWVERRRFETLRELKAVTSMRERLEACENHDPGDEDGAER